MLRLVGCAAHWCGRTMGPWVSLLPASPGADARPGAGGSGGAGGGAAGVLSAYCRDDAAMRRLPPLRSSAGKSYAATCNVLLLLGQQTARKKCQGPDR